MASCRDKHPVARDKGLEEVARRDKGLEGHNHRDKAALRADIEVMSVVVVVVDKAVLVAVATSVWPPHFDPET